VDEYYAHIFDRVPGLPEAAAAKGLTPLDYMKTLGAFQVHKRVYNKHLEEAPEGDIDPFGRVVRDGKPVGLALHGRRVQGFPTPSRKLEIWSKSMKDFGWPDHTLPGWIKSHVHPDAAYAKPGGMVLVPTFRLPTLIHTRTGAAKWLNE